MAVKSVKALLNQASHASAPRARVLSLEVNHTSRPEGPSPVLLARKPSAHDMLSTVSPLSRRQYATQTADTIVVQLYKHVENPTLSTLLAFRDFVCAELRTVACIWCISTNFGPQNVCRKSNVCARSYSGVTIAMSMPVESVVYCSHLIILPPQLSCMAIAAGCGGLLVTGY
jgi:hypothetical protein